MCLVAQGRCGGWERRSKRRTLAQRAMHTRTHARTLLEVGRAACRERCCARQPALLHTRLHPSLSSPSLFWQGHVYVGVPPLYKLEMGRRSQYCYTEEERTAATAQLTPGSYHVQRFKVGGGWVGGAAPLQWPLRGAALLMQAAVARAC